MIKQAYSTDAQHLEASLTPLSRVIRMKELISLLGLSRSTIYEKINPKSERYDPSFPKKIKLGASSIGWLEHDIKNWLVNLK